MRFRIDAAVSRGLRVIPDIPDIGLCRLEGRNGIGKTLAIWLLQLVTGQQPWAGRELSWATLRAGLGPTTISVSGLRTDDAPEFSADDPASGRLESPPPRSELVWRLLPQDWPEKPEESGPWTRAELDGRAVDIEEIRPLLRVFRIAGDESLAQSLAGQVQVDWQRLRVAMDRADSRRARWDQRLEDVITATGTATPASIAERESDRNSSESRASELERELAGAKEERDRLRMVVALLSRVEELRQRIPELNRQQEEIEGRQAELHANLARIDERAAEVRSRAKRSEEVLARLAHEEGLFRKRRDRLARRSRAVAVLTRQLQLSQPPSQEKLAQLLEQSNGQLEVAKARRRTHDRAGLLLELTDEFAAPLAQAMDDGLDDEIVAEMSTHPHTVSELHAGVQARHQSLADEVGVEGQHIQDEITDLEERSALLMQLANEQRLLERAQHDLDEVTARIEQLLGALSGTTGETYRTLTAERRRVLDELVELAARRADLDKERRELEVDGTLDEVSLRLEQVNSDELTSEQASYSLAELEEGVANLMNRVEGERQNQREAARRLDEEYGEVERGTRLLLSGRFDWLTRSGFEAPAEDAALSERAAALTRLRRAAEAIREELLEVTNDQQALERALRGLAEGLAQNRPGGGSDNRRFLTTVRHHYQQRFARQLSAPEVRHALFDGGTELRLDVEKMTTTWRTPTGERRTRPLEAFSSGERAFAYTRVQLEALRNVPALNKVAFLDEFGAFVARDRLDQLLNFIQRRALHGLADQIVVVLPLAAEPTAEHAAEIQERGYFTQGFQDELADFAAPLAGGAPDNAT